MAKSSTGTGRKAGGGLARPVQPSADLAAIDQLRPVVERLRRLVSQLDDTLLALGSDVMVTTLEGYGQLKLSLLNEILGRSSWSAQGADAVCCKMAGTTTSQRARGGTSWPTRSRASSWTPGISFASATALP